MAWFRSLSWFPAPENSCAAASLMSSGFFLPLLSSPPWDLRTLIRERRNQWPFLCPLSLCCFSTVRAATSSARLPYRPDFLAASLMCSYWRCSFSPTPRTCRFSGILTSSHKVVFLRVLLTASAVTSRTAQHGLHY